MSDRPTDGDVLAFIDLETLPAEHDDPALDAYLASLGVDIGDGHAVEEARLRTSLLPMLGRIACVGIAFDDADPMVLDCDDLTIPPGTVEAERLILADLLACLSRAHPANNGRPRGKLYLVAHNGRGFDFPFLQVRSLKHGIPALSRAAGRLLAKPWEQPTIDTMDLWPSTRGEGLKRGGTGSLTRIATFLGIEVQPTTPGSAVYAAWRDGRFSEVVEHVAEDVRVLREVYRRLAPCL